jgi:hypothetical protein
MARTKNQPFVASASCRAQKGAHTESELFVPILNDAILMMRPYIAEGDLLTFVIDILVGSFISETTVISMVMPVGVYTVMVC